MSSYCSKHPAHQIVLPIQGTSQPITIIQSHIYKASCWDCNDFYIGPKRNKKTSWLENGTFQGPFEWWSLFCYWSQHQMGLFWHFGVRQNWQPLQFIKEWQPALHVNVSHEKRFFLLVKLFHWVSLQTVSVVWNVVNFFCRCFLSRT